jgi:hypothetical protein
MYYAGLRPEEAINLRADDVALPSRARLDAKDDEWGELHLQSARPMRAATGLMTAVSANGGSSSIELRGRSGASKQAARGDCLVQHGGEAESAVRGDPLVQGDVQAVRRGGRVGSSLPG